MAKRRCDICGEDDLKVVPFEVLIDGKRVSREWLCRACAAVKRVLIGAHKPRR